MFIKLLSGSMTYDEKDVIVNGRHYANAKRCYEYEPVKLPFVTTSNYNITVCYQITRSTIISHTNICEPINYSQSIIVWISTDLLKKLYDDPRQFYESEGN